MEVAIVEAPLTTPILSFYEPHRKIHVLHQSIKPPLASRSVLDVHLFDFRVMGPRIYYRHERTLARQMRIFGILNEPRLPFRLHIRIPI